MLSVVILIVVISSVVVPLSCLSDYWIKGERVSLRDGGEKDRWSERWARREKMFTYIKKELD